MGAARALATEPIEKTKSLLRGCQLFVGADSAVIDFAAVNAELVSYSKGEPIVLENEINDHVYFVCEGAVEIISYLPDEKRVQRLALLKPGSQFADLSVLTKSTKSGSAYAYENSHLLRLKGSQFLEMLRRFPAIAMKLVVDVAELNDKVQTANDFVPFYQAKDLKVPRSVADAIPLSSWKKFGVIPLSIRGGALSVAMTDPNNEEFFQFVRTQLSKTEINAFLIEQDDYDTALEFVKSWLKSSTGAEPKHRLNDLPSDLKVFLKQLPLTNLLPETVHDQLVPHLKPVAFKSGQVVVAPGVVAESLLVIQSGSIEVSRDIPHSKAKAHVMTLEAGETVGDVSLLTGKVGTQTYRALEDCVLVPIPKAVVKQLIASPLVAIPMAALLAKRLQKLNAQAGIRHYRGTPSPDFVELAPLLPHALLAENKVVPVGLHDGEVWLGMVRTNHRSLVATLGRYLSGFRMRFMGVTDQQFHQYLDQIRTLQASSAGGEAGGARARTPQQGRVIDPVKVLDEILLYGHKHRASDIHFEPYEEAMIVRYRVDGVLHERAESIPPDPARNVVSRIKILSNMDIANNKITQDGQLKTTIDDEDILARASVLPVKHGEKVVLRLVRAHGSVVPLNMLVPDRRAINIFQHVSKCKQGLFLVTGPTGSGKTTTLYSLLSEINRVGINVVTLEDPVELEIPGTNQCEVDRKRGVDFSHVLATVLRQDPDVIMVGEIRDEESAKIVFEAAVTGHLVLSTLHTSYSTDVGPRLAELGVPTATIGTGLLGVVTQRLVRATCKKCIANRPTTAAEREYIISILGEVEIPKEMRFGRGCPSCNNTGYFDRLPVMEIWRNTPAMGKALRENSASDRLTEVARADGFETLLEAGVRMALAGLTTLDEVRRNLAGI